jgi:hypothetical protein
VEVMSGNGTTLNIEWFPFPALVRVIDPSVSIFFILFCSPKVYSNSTFGASEG